MESGMDLNALPLYPHQLEAVKKMKNGCILCGGVGTGKSRTALCYYIYNETPNPLYIITTARKRDTKDWEAECEALPAEFLVDPNVDSWNNIKKYTEVTGAFFIFDEQRVVGYGAWVKAFLKIAKKNHWILLSATPGDTWMDYIPVFIANGFYRNKRDFIDRHVVYSTYTKFPKVEKYLQQGVLMRHRKDIVVNMEFHKETVPHEKYVFVPYNRELTREVMKTRWDPWKDEPLGDAGALCYILRRIANYHEERYKATIAILRSKRRAIIFYNFDYELEMLRHWLSEKAIPFAEWNGHKHEPVPQGESWAYLVQYTAGAEGWNCTTTDTIIFFSQNYSYKVMVQAAGRIDRLNTPYTDLYYYHLMSRSPIDLAIRLALSNKKDFNERTFSS